MIFVDYLQTPPGTIKLSASEKGITQLIYVESPDDVVNQHDHITRCKKQLEEYFSGKRQQFDIPLDAQGTAFQQAVWQHLLAIPYGQVVTYRDIAEKMNKPKAIRAVGAANGRNPISIVVPCHRVIGSDGSLTGYAWGLDRTAWLLKHENKYQ